MTDLPLSRVMEAEGPDREMFVDALEALGGINIRLGDPDWYDLFLRALDAKAWESAALALVGRVKPGADIDLEIRETMMDGRVFKPTDARIFGRAYSEEKDVSAHADSPAIALLAALIRSKMETA